MTHELGSHGLFLLELTHAPLHGREALLSLPVLKHEDRPHADQQGVERQHRVGVVAGAPNHQLEDQTNQAGNQQPVAVMADEHVVQRDLLSEVLANVFQRQLPGCDVDSCHFMHDLVTDATLVQREDGQEGLLEDHAGHLEATAALVVRSTEDVVDQLQANLLVEGACLALGDQVKTVACVLLVATVHCVVLKR